MKHEATVSLYDLPYGDTLISAFSLFGARINRALFDVLVDLYRRSAAADEQGRAYVMWNTDPIGYKMTVQFYRTADPVPVEAIRALNANIAELTDDMLVELWKRV